MAKVRERDFVPLPNLEFPELPERKTPGILCLEDLVDEVHAVTELPKATCQTIVVTLFKMLKQAMLREEPIQVRGFGSFSYWVRKQTRRRHFGFNRYDAVPQRTMIRFTPAKALEELLNADPGEAYAY